MKEPLLPAPLQPGDRIGVVTPSWPVTMSPSEDPLAELDRGMTTLRELGFEPVLGDHALAETGYMAGRPSERAEDINRMFADPGVRAVIATHGGHVATSVLRHLDWELIAANPTIFVGFSNIEVLNLGLHAYTGLVTFHGNMVMWHLGMEPTAYDLAEYVAMLVDGRTGPVAKNSPWTTVRGGTVGHGRLIGDGFGLRGLAGTPYSLVVDTDVVLFFEGMSDPPGVTETVLYHLEYMGVFQHTRGVLVGNDGAAFEGKHPDVPFTDILEDVTADYDFPIVKCDDFGHSCPNTVLPVGAQVSLDPSTSTLAILEPFLQAG